MGGLKSSYNDIISAVADFFLPIGSKHCNSNGKCEWTANGTMLKKVNHILFDSKRVFRSGLEKKNWPCRWDFKYDNCIPLPRGVLGMTVNNI